MKVFAFFLPQFHTIPENDEWWGEGFTEWVRVKEAKPLFRGHIQPLHPLNHRYYNLLDKGTIEWQTSLLKNYHVDGMIYYHYYFNGKLLLEKPAENLLRWKDIEQPFFFCWANHPWRKTWEGSTELLMPMEYGGEEDWERHFQYLLPFFKDERYEKDNNKPLFMLFITDFPEKHEMIQYFDKRCMDEGFAGIAIIESYDGKEKLDHFEEELSPCTDRIFYREPLNQKNCYLARRDIPTRIQRKLQRELRKRRLMKKPQYYSGRLLMRQKLQNEPMGDKIAHGLWFEWDNTPRHKERGYIITPYKEVLFNRYMDLIKDEKYLFINAWNEWCEGMILEPTEEKGYQYLEWIKEWREKKE